MWGVGHFLYSKKIIKLPVKRGIIMEMVALFEKTGRFVYGRE